MISNKIFEIRLKLASEIFRLLRIVCLFEIEIKYITIKLAVIEDEKSKVKSRLEANNRATKDNTINNIFSKLILKKSNVKNVIIKICKGNGLKLFSSK